MVFVGNAQAQTCPEPADAAAVKRWRDTLIGAGAPAQSTAEKIRSCFGSEVESQPACVRPLTEYTNRLLSEGRATGPERLILSSAADLPEELRGPGGSVILPENIERIAARKGWMSVAYQTKSSGGFDEPPNLYLLALPNLNDRAIDVYLQVSPWHAVRAGGPVNGLQQSLTIITVDRSKRPPEGEARLLKRVAGRTGYQWSAPVEPTQCMECHTNPLRPISPVGYNSLNPFSTANSTALESELPMDEATAAKVQAINDRMVIPGLRWVKQSAHLRIGPVNHTASFPGGVSPDLLPWGWAPPNSPTRTDEFLRRCSQNPGRTSFTGFGRRRVTIEAPTESERQVDLARVRKAMNCYSCHNNEFRGALHSQMSYEELFFKIAVDRTMPPFDGEIGHDGLPDELTKYERVVLFNCLVSERKEHSVQAAWREQKPWLTARACEPRAATLAPALTASESQR